jgi:microcompartment protein CcmK/EutM
MFLARIDGSLTATVKHQTLEGWRLLIGRRLDSSGTPEGDPLVLLDRLGAGYGSTVVVTTDNEEIRKAGNTTPVRMLIMGLVDQAAKGGRR